MYSTTKSVPGPKLCFQVMLAHLLLGSTVTFHMDCSSGAGGQVRRGVSGEEGGSAADRQTDKHTWAARKGSSQKWLCTGPDRAPSWSLGGQARGPHPGTSRCSPEDPYMREGRKLSLHTGRMGMRVSFDPYHWRLSPPLTSVLDPSRI